MTVSSILAACYRRLNLSSTPPSETTTRLTDLINQVHRTILSTPHLQRLRDDTITFASVSGQTRYGLPPAIAQIQAITDRTTMLRLTAMTQDALRTLDPGLVDGGTPQAYVMQGLQAVASQPASALPVYVVSTSAGDTTQTVAVEGIRNGGYPFSASATLNGTTPVQIGTATDLVEITKIAMSAVAVGTVTIGSDASVATVLATLKPGQTFGRYQAIQLWPTPSSAITYFVDYMRIIADLTTNDEPLLPLDFHWMLIEGVLIHEYLKKDDTRRVDAMALFNKGLSDLIYQVACPPDVLPVVGRDRMERSRLGGAYKDGAGFV